MLGSVVGLRQDLKYAWRTVVRSPPFAIAVAGTLAIGIGANAAMFTLLDRLFLRPPAGVEDASSLRRLWLQTTNQSLGERVFLQSLSYPAYKAIQDAARPVADVALYNMYNAMTLGRDRSGPPVHGVYATANYFRVLGVRPAFGRFFTEAEDVMGAGANVVVVSHPFWRTRLAGDSAILGKAIDIGTSRYIVIGVADRSFVGLDVQAADIWMPLAAVPVITHARDGRPPRPWWHTPLSPNSLRAIVRLSAGSTDAELASRATLGLQRTYDAWNTRRKAAVITGSIIEGRGPRQLRQEAVIGTRLGGVAAIILLIACANVINLLLARATHRRREIAVRLALGISRARLVRLLTTETLLLALVAGVAALFVAWWGGGVLRALLLPDIEWVDSAAHWRVAVFTIALGVSAGLGAGIIPALQASKPELCATLQSGLPQTGARRSKLPSLLIMTQAALSVMLLVGAALFVRSLRNVHALDLGYDFDGVIHGSVQFWQGEARSDTAIARSMSEIARRLEGAAGIEAVATSAFQPMQGGAIIKYFVGEDSIFSFREDGPSVATVSSAFFETIGLRMLRGGTFSSDGSNQLREVVVNEAMAKLSWPNRDAIGECIRFTDRGNPCHTVVGVVENARRSSILEGSIPMYYLPFGVYDGISLVGTSILVRTRSDARAATLLRSAIRDAFPSGHAEVTEMTATLETQYRPWRLGATLFSAFGFLALLVAVVGIFSTVSYGVSRRTHEFGVRIALGAKIRDLIRLVVGESVRVVALGVIVGVGLALAAGKLVAGLLYGIAPNDPFVIAFVSVAMLVVAVCAALIPAVRAARVDPLTALRVE